MKKIQYLLVYYFVGFFFRIFVFLKKICLMILFVILNIPLSFVFVGLCIVFQFIDLIWFDLIKFQKPSKPLINPKGIFDEIVDFNAHIINSI
jgi:hypothetical protein